MRAIFPATVAAIWLCAASPLIAETPIPDGEELEAQHARIGRILISRKNIFDPSDPKENYWPYRLANKLHIVTREEVIRRELLFQEGDLYSQELIDESERNLRALGVIYHVGIRPTSYHDGVVDLEVTTQDTWTLRPSVRFSRAGGNNAFGFSFSEQNLLGRLKVLQLSHRNDIDRTTTQLSYLDPRILGSRYALRTYYADSSDGISWGLLTSRPFYSLDSDWSMNAGGEHIHKTSKLYSDGDAVSEFVQETDSFNASYGVSTGLVGNNVVRFTFGYQYLENLFSETEGTPPPVNPCIPSGTYLADPENFPGGSLCVPPDQKFSGPIFNLQALKAQFVKVTNYNQFDREEDFNLGNDLNISVWLSLKSFEAESSQVILGFTESLGVPLSANSNFLYNGALTGRVGSGEAQNVILAQSMEAYCRITPRQTFYGRLGFDMGINLDEQNQILLGGDTGLRGYPTRQFDGDHRLLLTLEHRIFTNIELFRLVRLGFAGFVDVGDAWYGNSETLSDLHSDFGLGLRFGVVRSSVASIGRLDLAYSVDADQTDSPRFQILFGTALKF
jgi:outer membrane protein assembly factor BamA